MRISITSKDKKFNLWLPNFLFLNSAGAAIISKAIGHSSEADEDEGIMISYESLQKLFKAIKKGKVVLKGEPLLSVESACGETVYIWL